jgi:hypothetical protein
MTDPGIEPLVQAVIEFYHAVSLKINQCNLWGTVAVYYQH